MSKAVIFIPRSYFLDSDRVMPHLGPLYLKTFLESYGHEIDINDESDVENLPDLTNYDVVGISTTTPQYYSKKGGKDLATEIRKKFPKKKIILGGVHAKNYYKETLEDNLFDHIVRGDGELAFLDILNYKELPKIISYPPLTKEQVNSFPTPWRDKEYLSKYKYEIDKKNATTVMTTRYCPMVCKFCEERDSKPIFYNKEKVSEDLLSVKKCGFEALMFYDDIFPINEKRTVELCEVIKDYGFSFRCNGHVNSISKNNKILEELIDSGCVEICLGIESADQKILDIIEKKTKVEDIFKATEKILGSNIKLSAYLMIGLPGESKETIYNTEKYIEKFSSNPNFIFDYTIFYPYRYTYIRENMDEFDIQMYLENSIGAYKQKEGETECCISTSSLSREEIVEERMKIIRRYKKNFRGKINPSN